jgi:hypothetical protein
MDTGVTGVGEIPRWKLWRGYVLNFVDMGGECRVKWAGATAGYLVFVAPNAIYLATTVSIRDGTPWKDAYCSLVGDDTFNICDTFNRPNFGGCPALLPYPSDMVEAGYLP